MFTIPTRVNKAEKGTKTTIASFFNNKECDVWAIWAAARLGNTNRPRVARPQHCGMPARMAIAMHAAKAMCPDKQSTMSA